jgi:hypothetical protein
MENLTINDIAEFSWAWNNEFFLQTNKGNFIWSDPDYNGDNTIKRFNGNLRDFIKSRNIPYVRSKGNHFIDAYCGSEVKIV